VTINGQPLGLPPLRKDEARHSPTGFQFGYGGSGPAELARAILIACFPGDDIVRHPACYQQFKWDKIATIEGNLLELTNTEVGEWYQAWRDTPKGTDIIAWLEEQTQVLTDLHLRDEICDSL
jgi:hypothetical protein